MRITGGKAARRILKAPKGLNVRPTPDLVKQAVFNSLGARVAGARVLELFAGSGALSLDCLSRGAASALCIEKSHRHAEFIRNNAAAAGFGEILEVRTQDVFPVMHQLEERGRQFDLILADPPYGEKNVNRRSMSFAQQLLDEPQLAEAARARRKIRARPHEARHAGNHIAVARSETAQARRQRDAVFGNWRCCASGRLKVAAGALLWFCAGLAFDRLATRFQKDNNHGC